LVAVPCLSKLQRPKKKYVPEIARIGPWLFPSIFLFEKYS
jgi:hypothetical protein